MLELSAKLGGGRDWFMAGELEAIVLCFERKISLHSKSRGAGGGGGGGWSVVEWFVKTCSVLQTYFRCKLVFLLSTVALRTQ